MDERGNVFSQGMKKYETKQLERLQNFSRTIYYLAGIPRTSWLPDMESRKSLRDR